MIKIFKSLDDITSQFNGCTIVLGNFDGLHLAHQKLLEKAMELSKSNKKPLLLITFFPHPSAVFGKNFKYLYSKDKKYLLLEQLGVEFCLEYDFNEELYSLSPEQFIQNLCAKLKPQMIITGYNFTFGKNKSGNSSSLLSLSTKYNFSYQALPEVRHGVVEVSSSYIRNLLCGGYVRRAAELLGGSYSIEMACKGENPAGSYIFECCHKDITIPKSGLYLVRVLDIAAILEIQSKDDISLLVRPLENNLPVHLERCSVEFLSYIRPIRKDIEAKQVNLDMMAASYLVRNLNKIL